MLNIQTQLSWYYLSAILEDLSSLKLFPTLNHNILKKTYLWTSKSWRYLISELKALPVKPAVISSHDIQYFSWYYFQTLLRQYIEKLIYYTGYFKILYLCHTQIRYHSHSQNCRTKLNPTWPGKCIQSPYQIRSVTINTTLLLSGWPAHTCLCWEAMDFLACTTMYNSVRGNTANTAWREFGRYKSQRRLRNIQVSQLKTLNFCPVFSK